MMRRVTMGLVLSLGLGLGLLLALAVYGRMGHLRALPAPIPAWSAALDDSAGLLRGSARLGEASIGWRLQAIRRQGPVWDFRLDGPGLALAAPAVLLMIGGGGSTPTLILAPVTGHLDSAALSGGSLQGWPEARLTFTRGRLAFDPRRGQVSAFEAEGLASAVVVDGRALGSGRFTLNRMPEGDWRLSADIGTDTDTSHAGKNLELRLDFETGQAVLAVVPVQNGEGRAESMLRAFTLPMPPDAAPRSAP